MNATTTVVAELQLELADILLRGGSDSLSWIRANALVARVRKVTGLTTCEVMRGAWSIAETLGDIRSL